MNLRNIVIQKVNEIGLEEAEKFFGKKKSTIQAWLRNGPVPLEAAQKVLEEELGSDDPSQEEVAQPSTPPFPQDLLDKVEYLNSRVCQLESIVNGANARPFDAAPTGYGFQPSPPTELVLPNIPTKVSQLNSAVQLPSEPPSPPTPPPGSTQPVTPASVPYLPQANSWCQPWPNRGVSRV